MTKFPHAALLAMSLALPSYSAFSQTPPPDAKAGTATAQQHQLYRGSKIIGSNVRDPKDKKIGQIKDLVLDSQRGELAYAVVSFGGVMGVGKKFHAIPWQALRPSDDGKYYILHADKETISLAPGFDKARWPDLSDRKWSEDVDRYWSRMVGRGFGNSNLTSGTGGVASPPNSSGGANSSGR